MNIRISDEIFEKFPDARLGIIVVRGLNNKESSDEIIGLIKEAEVGIESTFENLPVAEHPTIKAWRQAYKSFGAEKYRSSVESLVKRTIKGDNLNSINKLVDLYNYISLKYILPLGGENLDEVVGDATLCEAKGDETFIALFETENTPPKPGEVIYKDDSGSVLCRRWNWREADKTKLTEETKNAILVVEAILPEEKERLENATNELAELVNKFCGGKSETYFLDSTKRKVEVS